MTLSEHFCIHPYCAACVVQSNVKNRHLMSVSEPRRSAILKCFLIGRYDQVLDDCRCSHDDVHSPQNYYLGY